MIRDLATVAFLAVLIALVRNLGWHSPGMDGSEATVLFGFILLTSYLCGRLARRMRLPMITGYLLAGVLFGPHVLGAVGHSLTGFTEGALSRLSVFNQLALGLIALSAGGELKLDALRPRLKSIALVTAGQAAACLLLVVPVVMLLGPRFEFLGGLDRAGLFAVALLLALLAMASSPSSTIALILEYRSRGPLTTTTLGVTVFKDVVVIVLFSLGMTTARALLDAGGQAGNGLAFMILWEVVGSLGIGCALGHLVGLYTKHVGRGLPLILLALSFACLQLAAEIHLSGLLLCMTAGFYVQNFTYQGRRLIASLDRYSLPVFLLFFTIIGAQLELGLMAYLWPFVAALTAVRLLAAWAGTTAGSALAGDARPVRDNLWLGFITQAGVTLGLAALIDANLPEVGRHLRNAVVALVAVNQLIGPVAFRLGLLRSAETGAADENPDGESLLEK